MPASHAWVCAPEQAQCAHPKVLVDETTQVMCCSPAITGRCNGGKNGKTFPVAGGILKNSVER